MYTVALVNPPRFSPRVARHLSTLLGCSPFEAADRLQVPGRGPAVVAQFKDGSRAEVLVQTLEAAGFPSVLVGPEPPAIPPIEVAALTIDDWVLHLDTIDGARRLMATEDVAALVWGNRTHRPGTSDVVWGKRRRRMGFVWLFSSHGDVARIEERAMTGLDEVGFQTMAETLCRLCAPAPFDDRLLALKIQQQILGARLDPGTHLDLAINLVAYTLLTRQAA